MPSLQAPQIDLPSILNAMQFETTSNQAQQRLNIDKFNSTVNAATQLSSQELNKASTLIKKGGKLSEWLGTSGGEVMDSLNQNIKKSLNGLQNRQPGRSSNKQPASSGGSLP